MKNFKLLVSTIILALLIAGCGSDGGSNAVFTDNSGNIVYVNESGASASSPTTTTTTIGTSSAGATAATEDVNISACETYVTLKDNDIIKDDSSSQTVIKVISSADGTKKICVVSGEAHIQRAL
ncbi:MAG: hypothetical protein U9N42_09440 [Campylobacterota bacterium]|nr:hypothetical protein [Campylobacterota bacterium]